MLDLSPVFAWSVFAAGMISFFAPCIVPLLPVYVATLSRGLESSEKNSPSGPAKNNDSSERLPKRVIHLNGRLIAQTAVFIGGLATAFVLLGFGAGALGRVFSNRIFLILAGSIVIVLGLHQIGVFKFLFLEREHRLSVSSAQRGGILGSYLLGLTFSFGWTPCIGPVLAAVLVMASSGNQALQGALMMLVYTLGLAVPFFLISLFTQSLLRVFKRLNRHLPLIQKVGGVLIIAMGLLLMTGNLNRINVLFG